ncbi:MAG: hypothetical protein ACJ77N_03080 [Chloroflexota bacterium]
MPALDELDRLTVAFASDRHARIALEYLERVDFALEASVRRVDGSDLSFVDVDVDPALRERVSTLLRGARGIVVPRPAGS